MRDEQLVHTPERGAGGNEIIEHDEVRLRRQAVEGKYSVDTLSRVAEGDILIERDFEPRLHLHADEGGEIPFLMPSLR